MFTLKREFCGYEQTIKKKIDKYTYVQPYQNYGIWSKIINPTIDQCKSLLKAKYLRDIGIETIIRKEG